MNIRKFTTLAQIMDAVTAGNVVHWGHEDYTVTRDRYGVFHVNWRNLHAVGLMHTDGINSEYSPEDFYSFA